MSSYLRPFLIKSINSGFEQEEDILNALHLLQELGFTGRLQMIEFSILLQTDYDTIEMLKIAFPDILQCLEVHFLEETIH